MLAVDSDHNNPFEIYALESQHCFNPSQQQLKICFRREKFSSFRGADKKLFHENFSLPLHVFTVVVSIVFYVCFSVSSWSSARDRQKWMNEQRKEKNEWNHLEKWKWKEKMKKNLRANFRRSWINHPTRSAKTKLNLLNLIRRNFFSWTEWRNTLVVWTGKLSANSFRSQNTRENRLLFFGKVS